MKLTEQLKQKKELLIILVWSTITMMVTTKNSPLFIMNDWVDLNAFLTMGKGWAHGLIPYKDLFEQKGPALYFVFNIASRISNSYFGIYLIEVLLFTLSLYLFYKIARQFLSNSTSLFFCMASSMILTMNPYFKLGGSAEEIALPFIVYSIYLIFEFQKNDGKLTTIQYVLGGLSLSFLFWAKYTMIGSWVGFFLALAIVLLIKKDFRELIRAVLFSLIGFLSLSSLVVFYFYLKDALSDLIFSYFYFNIRLYPKNDGIPLFGKLINSVIGFIQLMNRDYFLFTILTIGLFTILFSRKMLKNNYTIFMYFAAYFSLITVQFIGGNFWPYYCLIVFPFFCVSLLPLLEKFEDLTFNKFQVLLLSLVSLVLVMSFNKNITESKFFPHNSSISINRQDSEPAQVKFAKIINKEKNPTLLNYGAVDMGFFQAADILPSNYYFIRQNIPHEKYPNIMNEQNKLINDKKVMFVVTRSKGVNTEASVPANIRKNYTLVAEHTQTFEVANRTYRLYKVKN